MGLVVAALVAAGHGWSLSCGLFLDDHAHYRQLRQGDWSYRSAVAAARLGIVGDVMDLWSRHEAGLRFYRPVAFWLLRAEYTLTGWRPAGVHAFSLAWHWLCAMLAGWMAWRFIGRPGWAAVAAGLVAVHPGHVVTVYWIACQTELMATAFVLAATLCYARYAAWWIPPQTAPSHQRHVDSGHETSSPCGPVGGPGASLSPRRCAGWLAAALVFYGLAMGCREHAIMWPAVLVAGDWAFRANPRRHVRAYGVAMLVAVMYLAARHEALGGFPLPGRPYLVRPGEPGFVRYIADKLIYYFNGLFAYVPVVPISGTEFFSRRPGVFYGTFGGVLAGLLLLALGTRTRRLLFPLAWMPAFFAPLLPVFASSHHLYLPGVAMAWLLAMGLAALAGTGPGLRQVAAGGIVLLHAVGLTFATWAIGWAYRAGTRVEDLVVRDVVQTGRPLREGDHLFFINLPMPAYYAIPAIEHRTGVSGLSGHVLTFSPWMLRMTAPASIEWPDEHTLVLTAPAEEGWFAGYGGRTVLAIMGLGPSLRVGDRMPGPLFDATVLDADEGGVRKLRFEFHRPVTAPDYHFYLGSPVRWACEVVPRLGGAKGAVPRSWRGDDRPL